MDFTNLNNKEVFIAPSLLAANFSQLYTEITDLAEIGVRVLHLDIMDGHFVPNISFGADVVKSLAKYKGQLLFDVHLMVTNPLDYINSFKEACCDHITFHFEAVDNLEMVIRSIKDAGLSVGISIKPNTKVEQILPYIHLVDLVLVMTVEPGFGGQKFINFSEKVLILAKIIKDKKLATHIQVDGGINKESSQIMRRIGANVLVAGTSFFNHPQGQRIAFQELTS